MVEMVGISVGFGGHFVPHFDHKLWSISTVSECYRWTLLHLPLASSVHFAPSAPSSLRYHALDAEPTSKWSKHVLRALLSCAHRSQGGSSPGGKPVVEVVVYVSTIS